MIRLHQKSDQRKDKNLDIKSPCQKSDQRKKNPTSFATFWGVGDLPVALREILDLALDDCWIKKKNANGQYFPMHFDSAPYDTRDRVGGL